MNSVASKACKGLKSKTSSAAWDVLDQPSSRGRYCVPCPIKAAAPLFLRQAERPRHSQDQQSSLVVGRPPIEVSQLHRAGPLIHLNRFRFWTIAVSKNATKDWRPQRQRLTSRP